MTSITLSIYMIIFFPIKTNKIYIFLIFDRTIAARTSKLFGQIGVGLSVVIAVSSSDVHVRFTSSVRRRAKSIFIEFRSSLSSLSSLCTCCSLRKLLIISFTSYVIIINNTSYETIIIIPIVNDGRTRYQNERFVI